MIKVIKKTHKVYKLCTHNLSGYTRLLKLAQYIMNFMITYNKDFLSIRLIIIILSCSTFKYI